MTAQRHAQSIYFLLSLRLVVGQSHVFDTDIPHHLEHYILDTVSVDSIRYGIVLYSLLCRHDMFDHAHDDKPKCSR